MPSGADAPAPAIVLANVGKTFPAAGGAIAAVSGVTLEIPAGEVVALLGPSGAGKTTILRLIAGLLRPDTGTIHIGGAAASSRGKAGPGAHGLGMMFQNHALWPHRTVSDNVARGLPRAARASDGATVPIAEALALAGLTGFETRYPGELSGGERQRVALARALVAKPRVLLLDEPLSNLDAGLRERMRGELRTLQRKTGMTLVYVTQDQAEALALSDRIAILDRGRLQQFGTPQDIHAQPANASVAALLGRTNLLSGKVTEIRMGVALVDAGADLRLEVPVPLGTQPGDELDIAIRPESIRLSRLLAPPKNGAAAKISEQIFLGSVSEYRATLASGSELRVQCRAGQRFTAGDDVSIEIDPSQCILFRRETVRAAAKAAVATEPASRPEAPA